MKFLIRRTSLHDDEVPPCEEAKREKYTRIDTRDVSDPKEVLYYKGDDKWWYEKGTNHRVEDGLIKRDIADEDWFIHINVLEKLFMFMEKYGEVVMTLEGLWGVPEIEIYDDYRE